MRNVEVVMKIIDLAYLKAKELKRIHVLVAVFALCLLGLASCVASKENASHASGTDGKYDSAFPSGYCSEQLEEISNSVKMINTIAFYRSYVFPESAGLDIRNPDDAIAGGKATDTVYYTKSAAGVATILSYEDKRIMLITCAHLTSFPDTILTFYPEKSSGEFLRSVAVKTKQDVYVADLPEQGSLDILVVDKTRDLALVGKKYHDTPRKRIPVFSYPFGKAKELEWGSFVYIFGYPMGYKMVTRGIVSSPDRNGKGAFLVDAVFQRGYSGGPILAVRDGVPNFELVGLVKSVPSEVEYILAPPESAVEETNPQDIPYKGEAYIEQLVRIRYGIIHTIPIESVIDFFEQNKALLLEMGYHSESVTGEH